MRHLLLFLLGFNCIAASSQPSPLLEVVFDSTQRGSDFEILVKGSTWLKEDLSDGSRVFVRSDGQTYSSADQSLRLESEASLSNGHDILGSYSSHLLQWSPLEIGFETQLRVYDQQDLIVFTQRFQVIEICEL